MKNIGKYKIISRVGQGGMGTVYKAHDPLIDRDVAIKVILDLDRIPEADSVKERFYKEAKSAGRLSHENITTIYDIGEFDNKPFIVMEFLGGEDLAEIMRVSDQLSVEQKLAIAFQICNGLRYAHSRGVVHRDVKPANIRVLERGRIKIMDFGIAGITSETSTLTQTSIGTPKYMSPEQVKGENIDHRTDIFSFGTLFYELLTGVNPFAGDHVTNVIYKILNEEPDPDLIDLGEISDDLQHIVSGCLAKNLEARYADFGQVMDDLNQIFDFSSNPTMTLGLSAASASRAGAGRDGTGSRGTGSRGTGSRGTGSRGTKIGASGSRSLGNRSQGASQPSSPSWRQQPPSPIPVDEPSALARVSPGLWILAAIVIIAGVAGGAYYVFIRPTEPVPYYADDTSDFSIPGGEDTGEAGGQEDPLDNAPTQDSADLPALSDPPVATDAPRDEEAASPAQPPATPPAQTQTPATPPADAARDAEAERLAALRAARSRADAAQAGMNEARDAVADRRTESNVTDAYDRAQSLEQTGRQQYARDDFDAAARNFAAATAAYNAIGDIPVAAAEPDPEPVATVDPNQAPAEAARTDMQAAKQAVREALRTGDPYRTAVSTEQEAERAYQAGQYADALRLYGEAGRQFEAIQTLQTPEEQVQGNVQTLVRQFESGFANEDLQTLRGVHADYANENWARFFDGASDVRATARPTVARVAGDQAQVNVSIQLQYRDNRNRPQNGAFEHTWVMQRSGDRWVVMRVEVR